MCSWSILQVPVGDDEITNNSLSNFPTIVTSGTLLFVLTPMIIFSYSKRLERDLIEIKFAILKNYLLSGAPQWKF